MWRTMKIKLLQLSESHPHLMKTQYIKITSIQMYLRKNQWEYYNMESRMRKAMIEFSKHNLGLNKG